MAGEQHVRRRLLALVLVPTLLLSGLLGYFGYRDYQLLRDGLVEHGIADARHVAELAEFGLVTGNETQLTAAGGAVLLHGVQSVRIYDHSGKLVASAGAVVQAPMPAWPGEPGPCGEWSQQLLFCAPVHMTPLPVEHFSEFGEANAVEEGTLGHVEVAVSSQDLLAARVAVIQGYALVLMTVLGMGLLMARRVERDLARPIGGLRDAVERVGRGDLTAQVAEDAHGELLTLQRGFNHMSRHLADNHAVQERRIAEATARLRQTLQELEQRNDELQTEKHRAEAASRAKSRFLAVMSHEIRTPLAGMIGMLELLQKSGLSGEQGGYVHHVEQAAETLRTLIDEILDYSRIEAGKLAVFSDPIRISRVVEEVVTMLAPSSADKGLELVVHMESDLPDGVMGDALRLRQVLINLTANAIKFTERGMVRIAVQRAWGEAATPRLRFVVEDTGIGIPADQQAQVFESFTQVDSGPTRRYGGSGLGATISRDLVQLMGGEMGLTSQVGEGSCFWFELPLTLDPDAPARISPPMQGLRVAVVESHPQAREAMRATLAAMGAEVVPEETLERQARGLKLDYLFLCENGAASTLDARAVELRGKAQIGRLCHVMPVTGSSTRGIYDCQLSKPVTTVRLQNLLAERARKEASEARSQAPSGLRVLVAEDDEINARVIEVLLRRMGHAVTRARDGKEALDHLSLEPFDLAVLDIRMPEVDGPTVAAHWRAYEREVGGRLPLVALTASGSAEDMALCEQVGIDEFLIKPINEKVLSEVIAKYVRSE